MRLLSLCTILGTIFLQRLSADSLPRFQPPLTPLPEVPLPPGLEIDFSSGGSDLTGKISDFIGTARREVLVSEYAVTETRVLKALAAAFQRGVVVALLLDPKPAILDYSTPAFLRSLGIPVIKAKRGLSGVGWHDQKYIIIDREALLLTSGDLTMSSRLNAGNLLVLRVPSVAVRYYNVWLAEAAAGERLP